MKWWVLPVLVLSGCASPPLILYTLGTPPLVASAPALGGRPVVIAVARVTVPDEIDSADIVVREGSALRRSPRGRWASRLSLGITDRLTERLAERRPDALVTDRPLTETPAMRVLVNVGRLDVTVGGEAVLDADWLVVPNDRKVAATRDRGHFTATGPVRSDAEVVALVGGLVDQLARRIETGRR